MTKNGKSLIFDYTDYRLFLRETYDRLKEERPYFSHRYFAQKAGLRSTSTLKLVMDGKRNLTLDTIHRFGKGLNLNGLEARYFEILVLHNQADRSTVKNRYFIKLRKILEQRKSHLVSIRNYDYLSNWYLPVIREMITCEWSSKVKPEQLAQQLFEEVTPEQVRQAMHLLLRLGLVGIDKGGKLLPKAAHLETNESISHLAIKNYHREMLKQAIKSIDRSTPEERELGALTIGINPARIQAAKRKVVEFIREMRSFLKSDHRRQVYQLNVQFFNISAGLKEDR